MVHHHLSYTPGCPECEIHFSAQMVYGYRDIFYNSADHLVRLEMLDRMRREVQNIERQQDIIQTRDRQEKEEQEEERVRRNKRFLEAFGD